MTALYLWSARFARAVEGWLLVAVLAGGCVWAFVAAVCG